ncbi:hypothetical protein B0T24DRAFT_255155 [Lasiosphaeria ovina]|uniref:Uncharacterized protein n=1 Tax=Lasiosphaeria ovina TaxID=92902 RepID=A0AAE0KC97_9PEZI|nr:hypothetical protein B0T24DRAFT_255155 [Lasiosphaeria ovina]
MSTLVSPSLIRNRPPPAASAQASLARRLLMSRACRLPGRRRCPGQALYISIAACHLMHLCLFCKEAVLDLVSLDSCSRSMWGLFLSLSSGRCQMPKGIIGLAGLESTMTHSTEYISPQIGRFLMKETWPGPPTMLWPRTIRTSDAPLAWDGKRLETRDHINATSKSYVFLFRDSNTGPARAVRASPILHGDTAEASGIAA